MGNLHILHSLHSVPILRNNHHSRDHRSIRIRMMMRLSSLGLQLRLRLIVLIRDWLIVGVGRGQSVLLVVHQLEWQRHRQRWQRRRQSFLIENKNENKKDNGN